LADADALSVDALCGFGAKNFISCTEFTHGGFAVGSNGALFMGGVGVFSVMAGSVMVRPESKWRISTRPQDGAGGSSS
jgi:hypothetical protein